MRPFDCVRVSALVMTLGLCLIAVTGPATAQGEVAALVDEMRNASNPDDRRRAASKLGDMEEAAAAAIPALIAALEEERWPKVRSEVASALGDIDAPGGESVPALYEAMNDPNGHVRVSARNALFRVDPDNKLDVVARFDEIHDGPPPAGYSVALYEDVSGLAERLGEVSASGYELNVYPDSAIATVKEASSPSGYGRFSYDKGRISGPDEGRVSCDKTVKWQDVDFQMIPRLAADALERAGGDAEVSVVTLSHGVFCRKPGWTVGIKNGANASMITYKMNGKVAQVIP